MIYYALMSMLRYVSSVQTYSCSSTSEAAFFCLYSKTIPGHSPTQEQLYQENHIFVGTTESSGALLGTALLGKSQFTVLLVGIAVSRSLEWSCSLTGLMAQEEQIALKLTDPKRLRSSVLS